MKFSRNGTASTRHPHGEKLILTPTSYHRQKSITDGL